MWLNLIVIDIEKNIIIFHFENNIIIVDIEKNILLIDIEKNIIRVFLIFLTYGVDELSLTVVCHLF